MKRRRKFNFPNPEEAENINLRELCVCMRKNLKRIKIEAQT